MANANPTPLHGLYEFRNVKERKPKKVYTNGPAVYVPKGYLPEIWVTCGSGSIKRLETDDAVHQGWIEVETGRYSIGDCESTMRILCGSSKIHIYMRKLEDKLENQNLNQNKLTNQN